ncbi:MAG: TRAP transporter small permease, partial [Thermotogae bacterium]
IDLVMNVAFNIGMLITFFPVLENFGWYKYLKSDVLRIPWTYLLLCFPIFILLIVLHNSIWIYKELKELITGEPGKMEEKPWE